MRLNLSDAVDDLAPPPLPCFFNRGSWIAYLKSAAAAQNHKGSQPVIIVAADGEPAFNTRLNYCADCTQAKSLEMQGKGIVESALEACRLRLRPIIMTSVAFIAGTVPLVLSSGAGAEVRSVTGITVFAGMLGVTQPRISDLVRGKIELFALDGLVNMAAAAGLHVEMRVRRAA